MEQLELPFANTNKGTGGQSRVWLLASDPSGEADFAGRRLILDPTTGAGLFGENDTLLIRHAPGELLLYLSHRNSSKVDLHGLKSLVASRFAAVRRSQDIISSVTDGLSLHLLGGRAHLSGVLREGSELEARTQFERLFVRAFRSDLRRDVEFVKLFQRAEKFLEHRAHPAAKGVLSRHCSEILIKDWVANDSEESLTRGLDYMREAAVAFSSSDLTRQANALKREEKRRIARSRQLELPGFETLERRGVSGIGLRVQRVSALQLARSVASGDNDPIQPSSSNPKSRGLFECFGVIDMPDRDLISILSKVEDPCRRLSITVERVSQEILIRVGVYDEFGVFFTAGEPENLRSKARAIYLSSPSANVERVDHSAAGSGCFLATLDQDIPAHQFEVQALSMEGGQLGLEFQVPSSFIGREVIY